MLKKLKQATLQSLKTSGISAAVHNSRWRRQRLLILAYHGISLTDEHLWNGSQFMPADVFRNRLTQLKRSNSTVLTLGEAVERRRVSDVPTGVLLSGGVDSSLVVALLARRGHRGLKTFSVGFETVNGIAGDEFQFAEGADSVQSQGRVQGRADAAGRCL